jgi:phage shock protein PspC (stress-responsive transcriptional regulator)
MKTILNSQSFELSDTSSTFLTKYLERMKQFIVKNNIEIEVYEDIEERVAEIFSEEQNESITDKVVINIVNEIWEPDEIFSELIENSPKEKKEKSDFKDFFSNKSKEFTRDSKKGIFFWVCYGIAQKYNLDPLLIRLFFIFWAFLGWMTILLYLVLILLLPNRQEVKGDNIIIDNAIKIKDTIVSQSKKVGKKLEDMDKKDLEDIKKFKDMVVSKAKDLWNKVKIKNFKDKLSSTNTNINKKNREIINVPKEDEKIKNTKKQKTKINNYSLKSSSDEIKEKIIYREVKPNIIIRFFRFIISIIKNIFYFIFHAGRFFLAFIIFVSAVPALITVLFASGLIFSNIDVNNQIMFEQVDFFLKIGIVWLLFSLFFAIFGIFLKILSSKIIANTFMISGLIGIITFAFIGGLGFFKTANEFTDVYTHTQVLEYETKDLHIQDLENFTNPKGVNWVSGIQFIETNEENITIEVTSAINRKSQRIADDIFEKLIPVTIEKNNQFDLSAYKDVSFTETVPYGFLRKEIKIYLPQNALITFGSIDGNNIDNISNIYSSYKGRGNKEIWSLRQCENTTLIYYPELKGYKCINDNEELLNINENTLPKEIIIDEIDEIISQELKNIEIISQ